METSFETRRQDKKEKAKKLSLQWVFSQGSNGANQSETSYCNSDRRIAGVCTKEQDLKNSGAGTGGQRPGNNGDGLLGSLLLEQLVGQFMGAVLSPFLPSFLTGIDISQTAEMADEFWLDRRNAAPRAARSPRSADYYPEMTYFPA